MHTNLEFQLWTELKISGMQQLYCQFCKFLSVDYIKDLFQKCDHTNIIRIRTFLDHFLSKVCNLPLFYHSFRLKTIATSILP